MKHTLGGVVTLFVAAGLIVGCGGLVRSGESASSDGGRSRDAAVSCGYAGESCCDGAVCANGEYASRRGKLAAAQRLAT